MSSAKELVGEVVGNYRIESLIDEGGMGRVYRARHLLLDRLAAIKIMLPELEVIPGYRARFHQEARAAAALRHPNIVEVYECGEHAGRFYLAMELVPDGNLLGLMRARKQDDDKQTGEPAEAELSLGLELVRQAALGLDYAHDHGMVHRDVKPANLLLEARAPKRGEKPGSPAYTLKVSDFGLARLQEGGIETTIGKVRGTLAYMSPEQCQGLDLDGRSDLYALGIILFELSTGHRPFDVKSPTDAIYKHIYSAPPSPRRFRPELPPELQTIILRCLAKAPADRYPSCADLAASLQSLIQQVAPVQRGIPFDLARADERPSEGHIVGEVGDERAADGAVSGESPTVVGVPAVGVPRVRRLESEPIGAGMGSAPAPEPSAMPALGPIELSLEPVQLRLAFGVPSSLSVHLRNQGTSVEQLGVLVEGVPDGWVKRSAQPSSDGSSEGIVLRPEQEGIVLLEVLVPQEPTGRAGDYPIVARAIRRELGGQTGLDKEASAEQPLSQQLPSEQATDLGVSAAATVVERWRSLPYTASGRWIASELFKHSITLLPERLEAFRVAEYQVNLENQGATASTVRLRVEAPDAAGGDARGQDGQTPRYELSQQAVELSPGEAAELTLRVRAPRRLLGYAERHLFEVRAEASPGGETLSARGEFVHRPVVPVWAPIALSALLCILALVGLVTSTPGRRALFYGTDSPASPPAATAEAVAGSPTAPAIAIAATPMVGSETSTPEPTPSPIQASPSPTEDLMGDEIPASQSPAPADVQSPTAAPRPTDVPQSHHTPTDARPPAPANTAQPTPTDTPRPTAPITPRPLPSSTPQPTATSRPEPSRTNTPEPPSPTRAPANTPTKTPIPISVPANVVIGEKGSDTLGIYWTDVKPGDSRVTGFRIDRAPGKTGPWTGMVTVAKTAVLSRYHWEDSGLRPGAYYCYRVAAVGPTGSSAWSNIPCDSTTAN